MVGLVAALILAVAAGGAGWMAYVQQQEAEEQARRAEDSEQQALQRARRAEASEQRALEEAQKAPEALRRAIAERDQAQVTQSRFLSDMAQQHTRRGDAGTATLLSLEALPDEVTGIKRRYAPEAERSFYAAHFSKREHAVLAHTHLVLSAAFSPDGARVVTASYDKTARL